MYNIPKLEAVDLLERYNLLSPADRANTVLLQRLKNEAEEVIARAGHHPEDYEALGCIYAFMNKEESARRTFYYALSKFPNDFGVHVNYAMSLNYLGFPGEAIMYARRAFHFRQGDLAALDMLIESCVFAGHFQQASQWLLRWQKPAPEQTHRHAGHLPHISEFLKRYGVTDDGTGTVISAASEVLHAHQIPIGNAVSYMDAIRQDDECEWVLRTMHVEHAGVNAVDLNIALAEQLAGHESLDVELKGLFRVRFTVES